MAARPQAARSTRVLNPTTLTHPEAANLLLVGTTAAGMLHVIGASSGETILLHGASGAVGVSVLQQAALRGIRVIGTASPARFETVRSFGGVPMHYGAGLIDRRTCRPHLPTR